jgi:hypothetical protein
VWEILFDAPMSYPSELPDRVANYSEYGCARCYGEDAARWLSLSSLRSDASKNSGTNPSVELLTASTGIFYANRDADRHVRRFGFAP